MRAVHSRTMSRASFSSIIKHLIIRNLALFAFVFTLFLWQIPSALAAFPVGWTYHKAITVSHEHIASDLTDFPLLVKITADADLGARATSSGADIRFATATGMLLFYEREEYHVSNGSGSGVFWVKVPRLSSTHDTTLYLYYGKSDATDGQTATAVWDSNFKGVWHLTNATDSTIYANNGTTRTGTAPLPEGQVAGAYEFPGYPHALISTAYVPTGTTHTMSTWVRFDDLSTWHALMGSHDAANHRLFIDQNTSTGVSMGFGNAYQTFEVDDLHTAEWYFLSASGNGSLATLYINGMSVGSMAYSQTGNNTNIFLMGARTYNGSWMGHLNGSLDEVRLSNIARSADWIAFEYSNMSSAETTLSIGEEKAGIVWNGAGANDDWSTGENWIGGSVPTSADDVLFDDTTFDTAVVDASFGGTIKSLTLSTSFTGSVKLAGNLIITGDVSLAGGTLDMRGSGYTLKVNGSWVNTDAVFRAGTGTILLAGTGSHTFRETNALHNLTLNDGLVGYWKFDEGTGTTAYDSSGYNNNGTLMGGQSGTGWTTTVASTNYANPYALEFDGSNDYVIIEHSSSLALDPYTDTYAMTFWIKAPTQAASGFRIMEKNAWPAATGYPISFQGNGTNFDFRVWDGTNNPRVTVAGALNDSWHFVVGMVNQFEDKLIVYLDGAFYRETVNTLTSSPINTVPLIIGDSSNFNRAFNGLLDDIRIYNRALSASEIAQLAAGNQPGTALGTYTLGSALDIDGDLTLAAGNLDVSSSNHGITLAGNWQNDGGVFAARSGTVTMDGMRQNVREESEFSTLIFSDTYGDGMDASLIRHWKLDDGVGMTATDSSGNNRNGILVNGEGDEWTNQTAGTFFTNLYAMDFDGTDDSINVGASNTFNLIDAVSVSLFVKTDAAMSSRLFGTRKCDTCTGFALALNAEGAPFVAYRKDDFDIYGRYETLISDADVADGAWRHIVAVVQDSNVKIFVDGDLVAEKNNLNTLASFRENSADVASVGSFNNNEYFDGVIDDVRIYNRALSATEVSNLASGTYSPSNSVTLSGPISIGSALSIPAATTFNLSSFDLTALSASITNLGTITEGTGKILHTATLSVSSVTVPATLAITLTDGDENIDGSTPDTVTVTIEGETVILTETGNATGVFTGFIPTAHAPEHRGNGIIENDVRCAYTVTAVFADAEDPADIVSAQGIVTDSVVPCEAAGSGGGGSRTTDAIRRGTISLEPLSLRTYGIEPTATSSIHAAAETPAVRILRNIRERLLARIEKRMATVTSPPARRILEGIRERLLRRIDDRITTLGGGK